MPQRIDPQPMEQEAERLYFTTPARKNRSHLFEVEEERTSEDTSLSSLSTLSTADVVVISQSKKRITSSCLGEDPNHLSKRLCQALKSKEIVELGSLGLEDQSPIFDTLVERGVLKKSASHHVYVWTTPSTTLTTPPPTTTTTSPRMVGGFKAYYNHPPRNGSSLPLSLAQHAANGVLTQCALPQILLPSLEDMRQYQEQQLEAFMQRYSEFTRQVSNNVF